MIDIRLALVEGIDGKHLYLFLTLYCLMLCTIGILEQLKFGLIKFLFQNSSLRGIKCFIARTILNVGTENILYRFC